MLFQQKYGDIFSIQLGSSKCIVVNDPDSVKEVLIAKGSHFDGRPDFKRFDLLFGGDKQNCEFSVEFMFWGKNCAGLQFGDFIDFMSPT